MKFVDFRKYSSKIATNITVAAMAFFCVGLITPSYANDPQPTVEITSLFRANMYPTGYFSILDLDLVFAPAQADIQLELRSTQGELFHTYTPFSPDYVVTNNVFARTRLQSSDNASLSEGDYMIDTTINGNLATRLAFSVYKENSSDPFAANQKVHYDGDWQGLGYLHYVQARNFTDNVDYQTVNLRMWNGLSDLGEDKSQDQVIATLKRDGEIFGYSKDTSGALTANSEVNRLDLVLFKPHTKETQGNVLAISDVDLVTGDHSYELEVVRQSDGYVLRNFSFSSKGGELVPLPRSEFGHEPQHEYLAPRALVYGTQNYEFETIHWLQSN